MIIPASHRDLTPPPSPAAGPTPLDERMRQRMAADGNGEQPGTGIGPEPEAPLDPDCDLPYDPELTPEENAMLCPMLKMAKQDFMEKLMFGEEEETGVPSLSIDI